MGIRREVGVSHIVLEDSRRYVRMSHEHFYVGAVVGG